tara:strand:- start:168 stop:380 length:213 start_codon:yes stop_codon:yes gene_type:complete
MAKSQTEQNTQAIREIKTDIKIIKENHLKHIEKDMEKQTKIIDKLDNRLWWVLGLLIASTVAGMLGEYML